MSPSPPDLRRSDDDLRRLAAERLADHLEQSGALLARCEELAADAKRDRLGPIHAAARLLTANAGIASALARVAQVETRHRSVVETIPKPDPKYLAWQQQRAKQTPAEMRASIAQTIMEVVTADRAQQAAIDAEDLRAATENLDVPLHLPY